MAALAYGSKEPLGPWPRQARVGADGSIRLTFEGGASGLVTRGAARAIGFELCGPDDGSCRFAEARLDGDAVLLESDGKVAAHVRYAWADSPTVNLFDHAGLPVGSFDLPIMKEER